MLAFKYLKMVPPTLSCNEVSEKEEVTCDPRNTFLLIYRETGDYLSGLHSLARVGTPAGWRTRGSRI